MREQANSLREEGGIAAPQHYPNLLSVWAMVSPTHWPCSARGEKTQCGILRN